MLAAALNCYSSAVGDKVTPHWSKHRLRKKGPEHIGDEMIGCPEGSPIFRSPFKVNFNRNTLQVSLAVNKSPGKIKTNSEKRSIKQLKAAASFSSFCAGKLGCCPRTIKTTLKSQSVALADMFLHYHHHTL